MKRNHKTGIRTGVVLAAIHVLAVGYLYQAAVIQDNPDVGYGWLLLCFIDFPVSLGLGIRALQIEGDYYWNNGTLPGLYLGIVGTAWWFFIGWALSIIVGRAVPALRGNFSRQPPPGDLTPH